MAILYYGRQQVSATHVTTYRVILLRTVIIKLFLNTVTKNHIMSG